jgi:hypothetical protein
MMTEVRERESKRERCLLCFAYHHLNDEETRCPFCLAHCFAVLVSLEGKTKERKKTKKKNYVHVDKAILIKFVKVSNTSTTTTTITTKSK